jgi:hypothetical protein
MLHNTKNANCTKKKQMNPIKSDLLKNVMFSNKNYQSKSLLPFSFLLMLSLSKVSTGSNPK